MIRKLASAQIVSAILPIAGADAIELAQVEGWQVVVKKGEFQPGDVGVFLEIDSVPPDTEPFKFLWKNVERPGNYRLRTMKLRGALSQGLLLSPKSLGINCAVGDDLTELLGVTKWDPPESSVGCNMGEKGGNWPGFLPKTDETRIQNVLSCLDELRGLPYVITLKCDGTSSTFASAPDGEFLVCSRNMQKPEGDCVYWKMARKYGLKERLATAPNCSLSIQAEIVGPGIQKNKLGLKDHELRVFNVLANGRYLDHDLAAFWARENSVPFVDIVQEGCSFAHSKESLLELAEGKYPGTTNEREGIVVRPKEERYSPRLKGRLSFKVVSNRFLLKEEA